MMLAQKSIAVKEHVSIASAPFILCMLQLIRIAHQKCATQCSESPYATIIALMNTFVKNFLLQHVFCVLNIATQTYYVIASTPFILCMLHVIRIAHPNCSIQHSESQKAYTITLSKIFILMQIFMLTHPPNIKVKNETADTCNIMSTIILTPKHLQMVLTDELFLSSVGSVRQYSLTSILEEQNINAQEHQCTQQSSYYDIDKFSEVAKTRLNDFSILTTNIESLNAKFDELLIHITELKNINFKYSVICLQETWLSEMDDMSIFHIDGYDSISQGKSCSNKGGLAIYIDNRFDYEIIMNLNMYKQWEGLVIKVKGDTSSM